MLCEQTHVESTLQITFTNQPEAVVTYLREGASQAIKSYLDREIESASYVNELYDVTYGRSILKLREYPVTAVAAVAENGVALTVNDEFQWYDSGKLVRVNGGYDRRWLVGRNIVDVSYTAGYATVPEDIRNVCARMVARAFEYGADFAARYNGSVSGLHVTSVSLEGSDSIDYADPPEGAAAHMLLTADDMADLGHYRRAFRL